MKEVAIVGAGELGGALAHRLARLDLASRIVLIDPVGQVAAGKALDIMEAAPIEQFATAVHGYSDITRAAAAAVVVVADRAGGVEWHGDEGLLLLTQLSQLASRAVVVCAGASQRELIEHAVRDRLYAPSRIVGSAPEAHCGAIRAIVALATNGSAAEVSLALMGIPPVHTVIPWEEATIGGFAATRVLDESTRRRIADRIAPLWPPGPFALAAAAGEVVACLLGRSRRSISCFVAPDAAVSGKRIRTAAFPVCLGRDGVVRRAVPGLSPQVQVQVDNATLL